MKGPETDRRRSWDDENELGWSNGDWRGSDEAKKEQWSKENKSVMLGRRNGAESMKRR